MGAGSTALPAEGRCPSLLAGLAGERRTPNAGFQKSIHTFQVLTAMSGGPDCGHREYLC